MEGGGRDSRQEAVLLSWLGSYRKRSREISDSFDQRIRRTMSLINSA